MHSHLSTPFRLSPIPTPLHLLVIAYGNTLRRDDGAGIGLARILVKQWRALGFMCPLHRRPAIDA